MKGPFYLPENIAEGDYIEIGQMGAYSRSIRTDFNGFNKNIQIEVNDIPLVSMYKAITENNQLALYLSRSKL
jgi:ornithine decarboxylase